MIINLSVALINVSKNQVFSLLYKSAVSQGGLPGSFSGSCQAASPFMIFYSLVALVLVSRPAKLRQDTSKTLARLSNREQDIFCQVHVWLMFDSKNGIPARVRLDYVSVWFKNFIRGKEGGRCTGGGKKGGKKKLRKVAGTEIKGCGWREVCTPPHAPSLSVP